MIYENFTVQLTGFTGGELEVAVLESPAGAGGGSETVAYREEAGPLLRRLEDPAGRGPLSGDELIRLGELFGEMLLPEEARLLWQRSMVELWAGEAGEAGERGLRLLIATADPWLESLPWEYVYLWEHKHLRRTAAEELDPADGFLARDPRVSIARRAPAAAPGGAAAAASLDVSDGLDVLFAIAEPADLGVETGRGAACLALMRTLAAVREGAAGSGAGTLAPRLVYRLTKSRLDGLEPASGGDWAEALERSPLPELLADEGRGGALSAVLADLLGGARAAGSGARARVFDFTGHGGLISQRLVDGEGRLRWHLASGARSGERPAGAAAAGGESLRHHRGRRFACRPRSAASGRAGEPEPRGMLVVEREGSDAGGGDHRIVWADEVGRSLARQRVDLVVLDTCRSRAAESGPLFPWSGLGRALLEAGVAAVVGLQGALSAAAAGRFAPAFYAGLASHGSLDRAVAEARTAVWDGQREESAGAEDAARARPDWGLPVLFLGGRRSEPARGAGSEPPRGGTPGKPQGSAETKVEKRRARRRRRERRGGRGAVGLGRPARPPRR